MKKSYEQRGVLDMTVLVVLVVVALVGGVAFWRIRSSNNEQASVETTEKTELADSLPENLEGLKTIQEIETIAGASDTVTVVTAELENEDGIYVYKVVLSDGRKLIINASTGEIISEESSDSEDADDSKVAATITLSQAYAIAASKSSSPVKKIELEQEDTKATYKVEYMDGSKLEIDATTGAIVTSEIKNESSQDDSADDSQEDEDQPEDESSDDSSEDSEDPEDSN